MALLSWGVDDIKSSWPPAQLSARLRQYIPAISALLDWGCRRLTPSVAVSVGVLPIAEVARMDSVHRANGHEPPILPRRHRKSRSREISSAPSSLRLEILTSITVLQLASRRNPRSATVCIWFLQAGEAHAVRYEPDTIPISAINLVITVVNCRLLQRPGKKKK